MWDNKNQLVNDGVLTGPPHRNAGSGWFGTVQVGCDYQIASNFVVGAFGDYDFSGIKGDLSIPRLIIAWVGEDKLKSSWAAGGRIGWLPFQQLMVFLSGGYTEARFGQIDFFRVDNGASANNFIGKHTESGWFIGTGYEYGIGWLPGLFWKTEYRYADYGKERLQVFITGVGPSLSSVDVQRHIQTVRSELVWRFNFGGPVVARY
jgi:outer membrane immunogenic protein